MIPVILALALAAQAPDSARQSRFERALNGATAALDRLRGAVAGFRTDLPSASPNLVLHRAARVHSACRDVGVALNAVDSLLAGGVYVSRARREQNELERGGVELRRVLARCEREWSVPTPGTISAADSLREWGPYRTAQLDGALQRYLVALRRFMKQAGLRKPAVS